MVECTSERVHKRLKGRDGTIEIDKVREGERVKKWQTLIGNSAFQRLLFLQACLFWRNGRGGGGVRSPQGKAGKEGGENKNQ